MEKLNKIKDYSEVKLVILEVNIVKEPMKCKPTDLEKFKEGMYKFMFSWMRWRTIYMLAKFLSKID